MQKHLLGLLIGAIMTVSFCGSAQAGILGKIGHTVKRAVMLPVCVVSGVATGAAAGGFAGVAVWILGDKPFCGVKKK